MMSLLPFWFISSTFLALDRESAPSSGPGTLGVSAAKAMGTEEMPVTGVLDSGVPMGVPWGVLPGVTIRVEPAVEGEADNAVFF